MTSLNAVGAEETTLSYETHVRGIRLFPGKWRPHYSFEQIAWISPPWACQDYLWLDFPEALFANGALYYLSHVNPKYPARFEHLPAVEWQMTANSLKFERNLPNGVRFGGKITLQKKDTVALALFIENLSDEPLRDVRVQTCAYLRALREFSAYTNDNKLVHTPTGWMKLTDALQETIENGTYLVGWRGGKRIADAPVIVCQSGDSARWIAMTWFAQTFNLTGNLNHPCLHADPAFPDIVPGDRADVRGALFFFEGALDDLVPALIQ